MACTRHIRHTLLALAASAACVVSLAGCGPLAQLSSPGVEEASRDAAEALSPSVSADALVKEGTLTVGVDADASVTCRSGAVAAFLLRG